jgi:hypothetical protein
MPSIDDIYSGSFVTASELPEGRRLEAIIVEAVSEIIGQQDARPRVVLQLMSKSGQHWPRRLVCNKTNALVLGGAFSKDYLTWGNRVILVWRELVMYQNRMVPGIRVQPSITDAAPLRPAEPVPTGTDGAVVAAAVDGQAPPLVPPRTTAPPQSSALPDDSIPF